MRGVNLVQNWSCKRDVAMSSSLRLPTCHVQSLLRSTKHSQQSPHGVFADARLCPDIWSQVLSRTPGDRNLSSCHGVLKPQRRTVDVSNPSYTTSGAQPLACSLTSSDKSDMRLFNPSVRQAHLHSTSLKSSVLSWLRRSDVFPA